MPDDPFDYALSRRTFVSRAGATGAGLAGLSMLLAACGGVKGEANKSSTSSSSAPAANHPKTGITAVNFSNWPLYIDKSVLKTFQRRYGGRVHYVEDINDNFD